MINGEWVVRGTPVYVEGLGNGIMYKDMYSISQVYFPDTKEIIIVDNSKIKALGVIGEDETPPPPTE